MIEKIRKIVVSALPIASAYFFVFSCASVIGIVIYITIYVGFAAYSFFLINATLGWFIALALILGLPLLPLVMVSIFRLMGTYSKPSDWRMLLSFYASVILLALLWHYITFTLLHLTGIAPILFLVHFVINQIFVITIFQLLIGGFDEQVFWR
jgi:hypothetical protein